MPIDKNALRDALSSYCNSVRRTRQDPNHHPETSLYSHFERVCQSLAEILGFSVEVTQQYSQSEVGAPDFAIRLSTGALSFIEAKPPTRNITRFTGSDREQYQRYMHLGNLIYTNFWELHLYQNGELQDSAELVPFQTLEPRQRQVSQLLGAHSLSQAIALLQRFFVFETPHIRTVEELANYVARAAWLVRDAVKAAMDEGQENSPLDQIYQEFRDVLFCELDIAGFADAYAQTLAYGLLLARQATQAKLTIHNVAGFVDPENHRLLSATLTLLSQPQVVSTVGWTIDNLILVTNQVSHRVLSASDTNTDPLLYFYEDFLSIYDPELRKKRGVYYTPQQVVNLQTRAISHILIHDFERQYGFGDHRVQTLDPAVGTGTYLVSALNQGCMRVQQSMGASNVPDSVSVMAANLHGFEILVGPYTVAHFRMASAVREKGGQSNGQLPIRLTDTLLPSQDRPEIPPRFGFMSGPLTAERQAADEVKSQVPIMVILGNPPYRRAQAEVGWVWDNLLETFREPVREEYSIDLKNLADLYVWFYRWAVWKLFEAECAPRRGILSFISNSRWILGGAFGGMRQVFRQYFDRIYIIDLHGDSRAPLPAGVALDQNVFDIQVGVAISICVTDGSCNEQEASVYYFGDTWGTREDKYDWLDQVNADLSNVPFVQVRASGTEPFYPNIDQQFTSWPELKDEIFEFSHSGVQTKRDRLVVAPTRSALEAQITSFLEAHWKRQPEIFHDTASRNAATLANHIFDPQSITRYGYRPLDSQYLYNDNRFIDRPRPRLQRIWGHENLALVTLPSRHGAGPVAFLQNRLPDICAFRGSYTSRVFPLWDNSHEMGALQGLAIQRRDNFNSPLLQGLRSTWNDEPSPQDVFFYIYAVLSAPSYSLRFSIDLARSFPRVPFPRSWEVFKEGVELGQRLVQLHSFEARYPADGSIEIHNAPQQVEVPEYNENENRVYLAADAWVGPVTHQAWKYSVSGYQVLRQWIIRRRGVPFDLPLRQELLDVIWIIEQTVGLSEALDGLFERLLVGQNLTCRELNLRG